MTLSSQSNESVSATIAAATISGELYRAGEIAKRMSLIAKNSRAIVMRAGTIAAGLKVISSYFAELAIKTIQLSEDINRQAIRISDEAVRQWRIQILANKLKQVVVKVKDSSSIGAMEHMHNETQKYVEQHFESFNQNMRELGNLVDDIEQLMRAGSVVAVNFRLESNNAGEYKSQLDGLAREIDELTQDIMAHVKRAIKIMEEGI